MYIRHKIKHTVNEYVRLELVSIKHVFVLLCLWGRAWEIRFLHRSASVCVTWHSAYRARVARKNSNGQQFHIILCSRRKNGLYSPTLPRINRQNHFVCVRVRACVCVCVSMCAHVCESVFPLPPPAPQFWDEIWEETDRFPSVCSIWEKKKIPSCDSNICFSHLSLVRPLPSLPSLPLAIQVASADDQGMESLRGWGEE